MERRKGGERRGKERRKSVWDEKDGTKNEGIIKS